MGYTHYWTAAPIANVAWPKVQADFRKLFRAAKSDGIKLGDAYGEKAKPDVGADEIAFNGLGDESHETFLISPWETGFGFTKTARKPYDAVCVAALVYLAAKHGYEVTTDGEAIDWFEGVKLARKAFGGSFLVHVKDGVVRSEWKA
jgi:hypothetical protein